MRNRFSTHALAAAAALTLVCGCTMKDQKAPPLTGPSELGTSLAIAISPDVLTQDGASQALVTVTARDASGQPIRNLSLNVEIFFGTQRTDFGSLSARNIVTGSDGRATTVYTAPLAPAGPSTDTGNTRVTIAVTPLGTNFDNAVARTASLRLVPPGVVVPPANLRAAFTYSPSAPIEDQAVLFDASTSGSPSDNPIASYSWDFGDGSTGSGKVVTHAFRDPGSFFVTLTVADAYDRTASTRQTIVVAAGVAPAAAFVVIPASPFVGQTATFDANNSAASPGRRLVSYTWDFGDGDTKPNRTSPQTTHDYQTAGAFTVTLTVTDDLGRTAQVQQTVTVRSDTPVANFTFSPPNPAVGTNVTFTSTAIAPPGRTISSYFWVFSDGQTSTAPSLTRSFAAAGTYTVSLGVTDSAGKTSTVSKSVVVQ